jgi:hypothetical protein
LKKKAEELQKIEENLISYLEERFPPLEYEEGDDLDEYKISSVYRAGQRDILKRLTRIKEKQDRR